MSKNGHNGNGHLNGNGGKWNLVPKTKSKHDGTKTKSKHDGTKTRARGKVWPKVFLNHLKKEPFVLYACKAARVTSAAVYHKRQTDEAFRNAWDLAIREGVEALEVNVYRRAKVSDVLAIFMLKKLKPEVYDREVTRHEISGPDGRPIAPVVVAPTVVFLQPEKEKPLELTDNNGTLEVQQ